MSKSLNSVKTLLKSVNNSVRHGKVEEVLEDIQKWADGEDEPVPDWDLIVGAGFWNRCVDKDMSTSKEELVALEKVYECLVKAFIRKSDEKENYMERVKVFAATLKFFVSHKRLNLKIMEELLQEVSKSSFYARKNEQNVKTVCLNFYALIWNYMREIHTPFTLVESLEHASLSIRWLTVLGLEQFQNMSHKMCQISFLLSKSQTQANAGIVADFFTNLTHGIVELLKQVVVDDSKNGVKVKKTKAVLPLPQFHGILNVTFVLARQLVVLGDFDKALKVFRPVTSVAKVYFDTELTQVWKNMLEAYVKICMVIMNGINTQYTEDLIKSSEQFRECRKQIFDLKFQKAYPGYAFSFMYTFTECIGFVVSHSKQQVGPSLLRQLPLNICAKFMKEILLAADASVALDRMKSGKIVLEGVTESRKVDVQSATLFHLLKVASERIADKDSKVSGDSGEFRQLAEDAYKALMSLANREDLDKVKSADLLNILTFHTCNIGYAYQKKKNFEEAMFWCKRSIDSFEAFRATEVEAELRVNALSIGLLLADCLRQQGKYSEGLRWLSQWLVMAPQYADNQAAAYDIYEQIPWTDWSVHWQGLQKEVCVEFGDCRTIIDYLEEVDPDSVSNKFASKVLRLEMNAYFSGRQTLVPAIMRVGQQLADLNFCLEDKVLGLICQAVGLWWVGTSESLEYAMECLSETITILDQQPLIKNNTKESTSEEPLKIYLSALASGWKGLCSLKINQDIAEGQLESLKEKIVNENPDKKEKYDGLYAVPGFTGLSIEDEGKCAFSFIQAAECFYQLSQMEDVFKSIADSHCPALVQITTRLVALSLSALGDKLNAVKAWYGTFTISKLYDRKGLTVLAASEILKILPHPSLECVQYAEKINQAALEGNLIKHNKAVFYRLDLAKAIAYHQTKNYKEGLKHLAEVYRFLSEKDNFDSTHHLMAEADYVLSLYRSVSLNQSLEFPDDIPELLCKMSPAGLTVKGYKLLGGLSRESDTKTSGWTDLLHNYYLLGSVAEMSSRTVKLLKETGKLRDLKCFVTDAVYFFQRLGIVSKSISLLVPLIETDISARNFYMAQIRIASIANVLMTGDHKPEKEAPSFSEAKKFLESQLKIPGLSISRLENISNLKWHLGDIDALSFHYRNRSAKYLTSLKVDCEEINIKKMEMKAPAFLRHPLQCFCYTCSHLEIIPTTLEFLTVQAKYAVAMKWKISMAVLELARLHHQRSLFRVLFNMEHITEQLKPIVTRKMGAKLIHLIYGSFFFTPGLQMQLTNIEICPVKDIAHIVHLMNSALALTEIVDSQDYSLKALPLELGTCALYEYFVSSGHIKVAESDIRQMLQVRVDQQEKENTVLVAASPDIMEETILPSSPVAPPVLNRKRGVQPLPLSKQQQHGRKANITSIRPRRILNSKAQQQQQELSATVELVDLTKVDNLEDERHVPVIPGPNFDDSNNS